MKSIPARKSSFPPHIPSPVSRLPALFLFGSISLTAVACDADWPVSLDGPDPGMISISVTPSTLSVAEGDTALLDADAVEAGEDVPDSLVRWESRDVDVATVTPTGEVEGVSEGTIYIVAGYEGRYDSTRVTVTPRDVGPVEPEPTPPPPSPSLNYPNEPGGNNVIAWSPMSEMFTWAASDLSSGTGSWWQYRQGDPNTTLHTESGIPGGPHYNRTRYPAGLKPGNGPVTWGAWDSGSSQSGTQQRSIYFSQRLRLVDGGAGDWESQGVGTKLGFWGAGRCGGAMNDLYALLQGGTRSHFTVRMMQQNVQSRSMSQNRKSGAVMRVGQWHHWEMEMVLNDVGRANGVFRWWIDGDLVLEYSDVVYRTSSHACGFLAYVWSPTWGGTGGPNKSRADYIDISDIRISGRALR